MKVEKLSIGCIEVRHNFVVQKQFHYLITSDVHFDNPGCLRDKYFSDLKRAREIGAKVIDVGDFFCLMNGRFDGRRSKSGIRPEYNRHNYLDLVINDAADQLKDYADLFISFSLGNHETSVRRNTETDPLERMVERLNMSAGTNIVRGRYQGFIRFRYGRDEGGVRTVNLFYHHGKFGGIVTKGTLGVNRYATIAPDADIIVTGHTHDRWFMEQPRYKLTQSGQVKVVPQYHIKTGCYKEEFEVMEGWAVEKIVMPKSVGGMWMTVDLGNKDNQPVIKISTDL